MLTVVSAASFTTRMATGRSCHSFLALALIALPAAGQAMFKCGSTFQDRPCESRQVQQRYSRVAGSFAIEQVNPNTDADCARVAGAAMPYWQRMAGGEALESVKAEFDARRISRSEKSLMRDVLLALREYKGSSTQVRSALESQCMASKWRNGYPTEREIAEGGARIASAGPRPTVTERRGYEMSQRAAYAAERRAHAEARRAAADAARAAAATQVR